MGEKEIVRGEDLAVVVWGGAKLRMPVNEETLKAVQNGCDPAHYAGMLKGKDEIEISVEEFATLMVRAGFKGPYFTRDQFAIDKKDIKKGVPEKETPKSSRVGNQEVTRNNEKQEVEDR